MGGAETPPESCFIDTNLWLYAFIEGDDPQKTTRAKSLIETHSAIYVSTQVINEVCVNVIKKARFSEPQVRQLIESFYTKYVVIELNKPLLLKASVLRRQYTLSFWDSVIVSSALHASVSVLYSEDMQDGLIVENKMRIINPLKETQSTGEQSGGSRV
jgi:predicted nucleic acid-binding protein